MINRLNYKMPLCAGVHTFLVDPSNVGEGMTIPLADAHVGWTVEILEYRAQPMTGWIEIVLRLTPPPVITLEVGNAGDHG